MRNYPVIPGKYGTVDTLEPQSIRDGAASSSLNWRTQGDRIELVTGLEQVGDAVTGVSRVSGIKTVHRPDGSELLIGVRGRKVLYFDEETEDWLECGTDIVPADAVGLDVSIQEYTSLAGSQVFIGNEKFGPYKVMTANPASYADMYDPSVNFHGRFRINQNRMQMWYRPNDRTGIVGSYVDVQNYTTESAESVGTGDGSTETFSNTLDFKSGNPRATAFALVVTDGVETFVDNNDGTLTGSAGGTGTVNYMTGAVSVTFAVAPAGAAAIEAEYQWENSNDNGITDFTHSDPRTAGQGYEFRQDDGGADLMGVFSINQTDYCFHRLKTWALSVSTDDTDATNLPFRFTMGIPNHRAAVETDRGIFYIDVQDPDKPRLRLLKPENIFGDRVPQSVSDNFDLSGYEFDQAALNRVGDIILVWCRRAGSEQNDTLFVYDTELKSFDELRRYGSSADIYAGRLLVGDSVSGNFYRHFVGFDEDDADITDNYWEGNSSYHGSEENKRVMRLAIEGLIGPEQVIEVRESFDNGSFALLGEVRGDGSYVDRSGAGVIGYSPIGVESVGGGVSIAARPYRRELKVRTSRYRRGIIKFVAIGSGYASVSLHDHRDVRLYGMRELQKYRADS